MQELLVRPVDRSDPDRSSEEVLHFAGGGSAVDPYSSFGFSRTKSPRTSVGPRVSSPSFDCARSTFDRDGAKIYHQRENREHLPPAYPRENADDHERGTDSVRGQKRTASPGAHRSMNSGKDSRSL